MKVRLLTRGRIMKKAGKIILVLLALATVAGGILLGMNKYYLDFAYQDGQEVCLEYGKSIEEIDVGAVYRGSVFNRKGQPVTSLQRKGDVGNTLGTYPVSWTARYGNEEKTVNLIVRLVDTTAPEIELVSSENQFTDYGSEYVEEGYSAYDLHDGDLTSQVLVSKEGDTITYKVKDSSGNEASVTRQIQYKDLSAPVITLEGGYAAGVLLGSEYVEKGFTAFDNHDGDLTDKVSVETDMDVNKVGRYTMTYTVSDEAGNVATATRSIYVFDKNNPNANTDLSKVVYLTFDDGASVFEGELLEILDKYNVKVTFFVTGNRADYRHFLTEASKKGHTVALHSFTHNYKKIYSSLEAYWEDLNQISDLVYELTGKRSYLVRLPGGSSNTVSANYCEGIMTKICKSLEENGYRYTDWNVSSGDAGGTSDTDKVAQNVIRGIKNHKYSIVLQHDTKLFSIRAVEQIIQWGLANGYTFLPMTDDSPVVHHAINN